MIADSDRLIRRGICHSRPFNAPHALHGKARAHAGKSRLVSFFIVAALAQDYAAAARAAAPGHRSTLLQPYWLLLNETKTDVLACKTLLPKHHL